MTGSPHRKDRDGTNQQGGWEANVGWQTMPVKCMFHITYELTSVHVTERTAEDLYGENLSGPARRPKESIRCR